MIKKNNQEKFQEGNFPEKYSKGEIYKIIITIN